MLAFTESMIRLDFLKIGISEKIKFFKHKSDLQWPLKQYLIFIKKKASS